MSWTLRRPCSTAWVRGVASHTMTSISPRQSRPTAPPEMSVPLTARPQRGAIRMSAPGGAGAATPAGAS
eukprot:6666726-Pyramimonas_sp.AAC.1